MDDIQWQPLFDKLVVRRHAAPKSVGAIVVPEVSETPQQRGVVVSAGPGRLSLSSGTLVALIIEPGDEVLFGKYSGVDLPDLGPDLVLLREDEILMVRKALAHEGIEKPTLADA